MSVLFLRTQNLFAIVFNYTACLPKERSLIASAGLAVAALIACQPTAAKAIANVGINQAFIASYNFLPIIFLFKINFVLL